MKHSLWCRIVMALAARRVCTCGASKPETRRYKIRHFGGRTLRRHRR